ncbi:hypothetical protein BJY04DRAFT_220323 [Aspergillus karnatakaensis]|uniref:uncharacterized protein n=1 Tax=Aspergillus karnatakaensis TaxID=1810916 RepID=UPI003CCD88AC
MLAIGSVLIGLLLLFETATAVVADAGFLRLQQHQRSHSVSSSYYRCSGASYANSTTTFTPLALIRNTEYDALISQLAAEHYEQASPKAVFYGLGLSSDIPPSLILAEVKETLTRIFQDLKSSALADTGTKLTFTVIAIPDFFNKTLANIVVEASRDAGIETPAQILPRTTLAHFENPAIREGSSEVVIHQGIHHCGIQISFDAGSRTASSPASYRNRYRRTKNKSHIGDGNPRELQTEKYVPLNPYRSERQYRRLMQFFLRSNANAIVGTQLQVGADPDILLVALARARMVLKRQDPAVLLLGTESRSADYHMTLGEVEGGSDDGVELYLESVPLDLDDSWWLYGSNPGSVKLSKELVLKMDKAYVDALASNIGVFVQVMQEEYPFEPPAIEHAIILTDWVDGDLVRLAVQKALGDDISIVGGTLSEVTLVADAAARLALIRQQNLLKIRQYSAWHDEL